MLELPRCPNRLYYGDNLDVLREHIASESVDLIYLDPPFNSNANYNVLFREPEGLRSQAQIEAFEDTWQWSIEAEEAYDDVLRGTNQTLGKLIHALRDALGDNSMMAYLVMMAVRLAELHRVLKRTGSLYLHCDPTASHYLKLVLDAVFGAECFGGEIIWRRTNARNTEGRWPRLHDTILHYGKRPRVRITPQFVKGEATKMPHTLVTGPGGLKYNTYELTGAGLRSGETGQPWRGFDPSRLGRHWGNLHAQLEEWAEAGLIHWPANGGFPRRRDAEPFDVASRLVPLGDVWTDIDRLNQTAKERLGYPTQKPLALLERIIGASSNPGDVVLDPFCGCGTTIHSAQRLNRRWIGIDITHLAISLIESRLVQAFPGIDYELLGTPKDLAGAKALAERSKHQFEWWALSLVKAQPANDKKKGSDKGIDGLMWVRTGLRERAKIVVSVKGGYNINVQMVRDLWGVIEREQAAAGLFVTLHEPTRPMIVEAAKAGFYEVDDYRYPRIQILTIEDLLGGQKPDLPLIDHAALVKLAAVDPSREMQPALL